MLRGRAVLTAFSTEKPSHRDMEIPEWDRWILGGELLFEAGPLGLGTAGKKTCQLNYRVMSLKPLIKGILDN